ncbi:diaminopimelate epimerase [Silvibacterium acidisoli]|uniref:diaminopimelate epimerase n=1 Tax=Acidobacteriaceae bacterium ZG23-2 TaxID=2883246 RepID=UPI00406D3091
MTQFAKAHACGNDFLIVEGSFDRELAVRLCERNTGVGADGVEFLGWTGEREGVIRLANADGSIAEISGNGTRCVAAWIAYRKKAVAGDLIRLETDAGMRECTLVKAEGHRFLFSQGMGVPQVHDGEVCLSDGSVISGVVVSTGNPHFVIFVEDESFKVKGQSWQEIGKGICFHQDFPEQTNVEFVHILSKDEIEIRIFERGVGPTTSSGTGTCATAAATIARRGASPSLLVRAPGGEQRVEWAGEGMEITLTGPAELIAKGDAWL